MNGGPLDIPFTLTLIILNEYKTSLCLIYFMAGNQEVISATVGVFVDTLVNPGISF